MKKVLKNIDTDQKSVTTKDEDEDEDEVEEDKVTPIRKQEGDSPSKKHEGSASASKKKENRAEGADLIVAEERHYDKVTFGDYVRLFRFSYGVWAAFLYFFQCVFCASIQLFITYFLTYWTSQKFEEQ